MSDERRLTDEEMREALADAPSYANGQYGVITRIARAFLQLAADKPRGPESLSVTIRRAMDLLDCWGERRAMAWDCNPNHRCPACLVVADCERALLQLAAPSDTSEDDGHDALSCPPHCRLESHRSASDTSEGQALPPEKLTCLQPITDECLDELLESVTETMNGQDVHSALVELREHRRARNRIAGPSDTSEGHECHSGLGSANPDLCAVCHQTIPAPTSEAGGEERVHICAGCGNPCYCSARDKTGRCSGCRSEGNPPFECDGDCVNPQLHAPQEDAPKCDA